MKLIIYICFFLLLSTLTVAQTVILAEDFEGPIVGWSKSVTSGNPNDNEWFILPSITGPFGATTVFGVSNDGTNNNYDVTETSDAVGFIALTWPASLSTMTVNVQFDLIVGGEDFLTANIDFFRLYLVDLDPNVTVPVAANLNGGNSITVSTQNLLSGWNRFDLALTAGQKSFIDGAVNNVMLVFAWENDGSLGTQPPAAFDNLLVTATPSSTPALAGDYTVGRLTGNNFRTLTDAVAYLNVNGASADVNFFLTDEVYDREFETFPIEIGDDATGTPFPGAGTHTITIKPDPTTNPTPTITKSTNLFGGDIDNHGAITIWGVSNVVIDGSNTVGGTTRDLTIIDNSTGSPTNAPIPIYVAGASESISQDDITLKNLNLSTSSQTYGYGVVVGQHTTTIVSHFADEALFDNINITNNSISSVREGIHVDGADRISPLNYTTNSLVTNLTISQNEMQSSGVSSIQERGIHVLGVDGGLISQNTIGNFDQSDLNADVGIVLDQLSKNTTIERNEIFNIGFSGDNTTALSAHGMEIYNGVMNSNVVIRNNVLRGIGGNGASSYANAGFLNPVAMFMGQGGEVGVAALINQSGYEIYNNSIYMFGDEMDFTTSVSMALTVASNVTDVVYKNNLVKNTLGGDNSLAGKASALAVFAETNSAQLSDIDYNGYFIDANTASTNNFVGLIGSIASILGASTDMDGWRTDTGQETSTLFGDPGYTSSTNLVPDNTSQLSWVAHGTGIPTTLVANDFNNTSRPTTVPSGNPDMGAYEFNNNPATNPPPTLTFAGPLAVETTYTFDLYQRDWGSVKFNTGSDLPDDFSVTYFNGVFPADETLFDIANGYFEIDATENANTNYDYELTINYDEAYLGTMGTESPTMLVANDPLKTDIWNTMPTTNNTTNNTSIVVNTNRFGRMAQSNTAKPLPVEYVYFKGKADGENNLLEWSTATEVNNDKFEIEKTIDLEQWEIIGKIDGKGNSTSKNCYDFTDSKVSSKLTYYRLVQIDFDGQVNYSNIVTVNNEFVNIKLSVSPMPARDYLKVRLINKNQDSSSPIMIVNSQGINQYNGTLEPNVEHQIDVSSWQRGLYILIVSDGINETKRKLFLK